jgi:hypothetical protein
MQFIPIPKTVMVEIRYNYLTNLAENTLYFLSAATVTRDLTTEIAQKIGLWWYTYLRHAQNTGVTLRDILATDLTTENSFARHDLTYVGQPGAYSGGTLLPSNVTFCLSFRTGYAGRSFRGRNYLIGLTTSMLTNNNFKSTDETSLRGYYDRLIYPSADLGENWTWVVASRFHDKAPREVGMTTPVESVLATDLIVDNMRKRLPSH